MKHFYFVILFIACLFHNLCVAAGAEDYCQTLERHIVRSCGRDITARKALSGGLLDAVVEGADLAAPAPVDWRGCTLADMVSNLRSIQKIKLDKRAVVGTRTDGSPYVTAYNRYGAGDPYPLTIQLDGSVQRLVLNYNGHHGTHQPGNCLLTDANTGAGLTYDGPITIDNFLTPPYKLLMAVEIVRRKAVDPHRADGMDEHADIPVAVGVMMATKLAQGGTIDINHFWLKTGLYHIFTGTNASRMANFQTLLGVYRGQYGWGGITETHATEVYEFSPPPSVDLSEIFGALAV